MVTLVYFTSTHSNNVQGVESIPQGAFFNKEEFDKPVKPNEYTDHVKKCSLSIAQIHEALEGGATEIEVIKNGQYVPITGSGVRNIYIDRQHLYGKNGFARGDLLPIN